MHPVLLAFLLQIRSAAFASHRAQLEPFPTPACHHYAAMRDADGGEMSGKENHL
jgi:hypothetical protein